eukprot:scaffold4795_cov191-Skeletonema_marinoi.AAC.2
MSNGRRNKVAFKSIAPYSNSHLRLLSLSLACPVANSKQGLGFQELVANPSATATGYLLHIDEVERAQLVFHVM